MCTSSLNTGSCEGRYLSKKGLKKPDDMRSHKRIRSPAKTRNHIPRKLWFLKNMYAIVTYNGTQVIVWVTIQKKLSHRGV
jgi:hypothetical protein